MSVVIECVNVVVRRSEIEHRFPGGMAGYEAACPNQTFCADQELARVGFMAPRDVETFLLRVLCPAGLASCPSGRAEGIEIEAASVAVVEQGRGSWYPEHSLWLRYAVRRDGVALCWLDGKPQGKLAAPPGWKPEHSLEYAKLDADVEGEPVALESLDTLPPVPDGHVRLFHGRAYSDDDSRQSVSTSEKGGPLLPFLTVTAILTFFVGGAATIGLFLWAVGLWSPRRITQVLLIIFFVAGQAYYLKTRPAKQAVYAYIGVAILILVVRWLLGKM